MAGMAIGTATITAITADLKDLVPVPARDPALAVRPAPAPVARHPDLARVPAAVRITECRPAKLAGPVDPRDNPAWCATLLSTPT